MSAVYQVIILRRNRVTDAEDRDELRILARTSASAVRAALRQSKVTTITEVRWPIVRIEVEPVH